MFSSPISKFIPKRDPAVLNRRGFLLVSAAAAGTGLSLGVMAPGAVGHARAADAGGAKVGNVFNPFVRITPDNKVIVISKHLDKGQGTATGLATLVAEELDASWEQMQAEFAPADAAIYQNTLFGVQGTGGSTAMANSFEQYRRAGAAARQMLVAAAASAWGVAPDTIKVANGVLSDGTHTATFGEMAEQAAKQSVPAAPKLKEAKDFVFIGKTFPRLDAKAKTSAAPLYTQDVHLPDMVTAVIARPPNFGATVSSFDASAAKKIAGVVDVVQIPQGVAVLATNTWAAIQGRDALKVTWDKARAEVRSSATMISDYKALAQTAGKSVRRVGSAVQGLERAVKTIEAEYVFPFLAHATLEPMNCVMQLVDGRATIWTGSQLQTVDQNITAAILGVRPEDVAINTLWAGGSFGRRAVYNADYVAETAELVKAYAKPVPVKVVWTRDDDIRGGYYRPLVVHRVRAGVTAEGDIAGWQHSIVTQSIMAGTAFESMAVKDGIDGTSIEGVADSPYDIANFEVELHTVKNGVPPLWWRSVGHSHTAYVMETMIDELAALAAKDPVEFRLKLLANKPRHAAVLKLAAEKAGWGNPNTVQGVGRGIAVHESFKSFVAQVADVRIVDGKPKVDRVVCAVDCGLAINPDNIASQMEGGIGYGLGAVLHSEITLKDGVVEQSNFDGYQVLRFDEMPVVEVHLVPSAEPPTGVGEPGLPPIGPAVANAVAALTGKRLRDLPMAKHKLDGAA
jgi:isoquinoline 1-oxidoreductase subunit beta